MTRQVTLFVNDSPIAIDPFVEGFIDHTVGGMITSLKETGDIQSLEINIKVSKVEIKLNENIIPLKGFPHLIIASSIKGMVSVLKGVRELGNITRINLNIKR